MTKMTNAATDLAVIEIASESNENGTCITFDLHVGASFTDDELNEFAVAVLKSAQEFAEAKAEQEKAEAFEESWLLDSLVNENAVADFDRFAAEHVAVRPAVPTYTKIGNAPICFENEWDVNDIHADRIATLLQEVWEKAVENALDCD